MTESDVLHGPISSGGVTPRSLPSFASFAAKAPDDSLSHEYANLESPLLHPQAVPARRRAFRLGRAAAHAALAAIGRDEAPILAGVDRQPLWPPGIVGSISHTSELGVALVAPADHTDGVGLDVESRRYAPELGTQVPRPEERRWLDKERATDQDDLLLALFSAKESLFKAFYPRVGRFFGFEAASLQPVGAGFAARIIVDLDSDYPPDRVFTIGCQWFGDLVLTWLVLPNTPRPPPT